MQVLIVSYAMIEEITLPTNPAVPCQIAFEGTYGPAHRLVTAELNESMNVVRHDWQQVRIPSSTIHMDLCGLLYDLE
jgi:hypothetical protein